MNHTIYMREWLKNPENLKKHKEIQKVYYKKNRDSILLKIKTREDKNRDKLNSQRRKNRQLLRKEVLIYYSNGGLKCNCCDEENIVFLTIDHINGGGRKHLKQISGHSIYSWLRKENFPKGYQVLCYNCNCGRSKCHGVCPHKLDNFI